MATRALLRRQDSGPDPPANRGRIDIEQRRGLPPVVRVVIARTTATRLFRRPVYLTASRGVRIQRCSWPPTISRRYMTAFQTT